MKPSTAAVLLIALVCAGQTLAYYDEVDMSATKCEVATYQADNEGEC